MSRKKRGFQEFLSVVFSVFLLSFTLLFLDDFSDSLSGFASQLLSLSEQTELDVVSLSEMVITQEKTSANIYGFGSGTKTDAVSSDVTTPEDIKKIMNDALSVYANIKKTGGKLPPVVHYKELLQTQINRSIKLVMCYYYDSNRRR